MTVPPDLTTVVPGLTFTEGSRWHDGRLWFSDLYTFRVMSCLEDGSDLRTEATIPERPSGLGWLADGRLLIVSMMDRKLMRREHDGTVVVHADLSGHVGGPLGDLVVDGLGRAYLGDFGFELYEGAAMKPARLYRVDPDGTITVVASDLWFPNGCAITPDRTLLVNETFGNRVTAFDISPDGDLSNRRVWAEFGPLPSAPLADDAMHQVEVAPDGCCLDSEGGLWLADIKNSAVRRVVEGGTITDDLKLDANAFACALGGPDGRTLFLCLAPEYDPDVCMASPQSTVAAVQVRIPAVSHVPAIRVQRTSSTSLPVDVDHVAR